MAQDIELLAPAKDLNSGRIAINYGADAVYIGADRFGARAAAGNSIEDIEALISYAHQYRAKVFVTMNTILFDDELETAQSLIHALYDSGADALIIQDMGILKLDIPPIALHASTQTHNYDLDRIKFLDQVGFERIILARELSLEALGTIRKSVQTDLECFIHGALCVSLSGQCYFSQTVTGRSANRGSCAQMCRHPYDLLDATGTRIVSDRHLLSLKDLNLSDHIQELVTAGISSLKIEGRLKAPDYVKNVVSYYRQRLDQVLEENPRYGSASSGKTSIGFQPDPERSFNRQSTNYFLAGRPAGLVNQTTPKSMGKYIGSIRAVERDHILIDTHHKVSNGDGLCTIKDNQLLGLRVETVDRGRIRVSDLRGLRPGMEIYRNYDHEFSKALEADQSIRKVAITIHLKEEDERLMLESRDEDGICCSLELETTPEIARDADQARQSLIHQLAKAGQSMFSVTAVTVACQQSYFFPLSQLNHLRRSLLEQHAALRRQTFRPRPRPRSTATPDYPRQAVDFRENISNHLAADFYREHGVLQIQPALEISQPERDQLLMTTRYCLKYELGFCSRFQPSRDPLKEPLFLKDHHRTYSLHFDCQACLMQIRLHKSAAPGQV